MSKKKKQSISMEGNCGKGKGKNEDSYFDRIDYEVSSVLLQLSHPVVFSSSSSSDSSPPLFHKWGRTKKRSSSSSSPVFSPEPPLIKSVGDLGSNSSSSCLTGEAKKTNSQTIKKGLEEEFCTKNQTSSSQFNTSCSVLEAEMGLLRAQVGLIAQPIRVDQNLRPLISVHRTVNVSDKERRSGIDLNLLPAAEEGGNGIFPLVGFERVASSSASKIQAAAQARQRRLGLIRSKKLYTRFISSYQLSSRDG
ncbi:PREDICTED: uncharacterized protein LOC104702323 isoform X1 [Camelina sativa]|uniref:Uncharacterized protein LOC104702323 isoform X1 n=1 Tax=Camelina sativa TaxID=90675 RepID=A0ABM0SUV9_CAMSA|nr:PREDICTED: uncharacterized protein LOC104702323 isoform X1 [Camelina sativa]